ncbi:hypothetical protein BpHYR1_040895 [Brachionus plicatilis]|uniref:Uncharacterized protein n=1 Tax=Brachionus plicatilis TaxID=10195 RepID=A0A3M7RSN2_BRAPC|nr:hypothetical protein BpHYR1_040895 [Brachionus plicatilis]
MNEENKGKRQDSFSDESSCENDENTSELFSENISSEERNLEKNNDAKLEEGISYKDDESTQNVDFFIENSDETAKTRNQEIENKLLEQINLYGNTSLLRQNEKENKIEINKLKEEIKKISEENMNFIHELDKTIKVIENQREEIKNLNENIETRDRKIENLENNLEEQINLSNNIALMHHNEIEAFKIEIENLNGEIENKNEEIQNFVTELFKTREALEYQREENSKLSKMNKIIYEINQLKNMIRNSEPSSAITTPAWENSFIQNDNSYETQLDPEWLCHVLIDLREKIHLNSNAMRKFFEILNKFLDLLKDDQLILIDQLLSDLKDDKLLAKYQLFCRLISLQPQRKLELFGIFIRDLENLIKGTDENVLDRNFQIEYTEMYSTIKSILEMVGFNVPEVIDLDTIEELKINLIE